jgi:hypothetical protein
MIRMMCFSHRESLPHGLPWRREPVVGSRGRVLSRELTDTPLFEVEVLLILDLVQMSCVWQFLFGVTNLGGELTH